MNTPNTMHLTLRVWRQKAGEKTGKIVEYAAPAVSPDMSFLEMLDVVNEDLTLKGEDPIAFEHDCREGICGSCSLMINGEAHGPEANTTTCQLHMRKFRPGEVVTIEPFRARAFPIVKDLVVDRGAFDRIIQAGGFISAPTGSAPDGNAIPVPKDDSDKAMDAAQCIGCGACVASCKNASAALFVSAKIGHLATLPQGRVERETRALSMIEQAEKEGFGGCTNTNACEAACPKGISVEFIAQANREYMRALLKKG